MKREDILNKMTFPRISLKDSGRDSGLSSYRTTFTGLMHILCNSHWMSDEKWMNLFASLMISWFQAEPYILTDDSQSIIKLLQERGLLHEAFVNDLLENE